MHTEHLRIPVGAGHLHAERVGRGGLPVVLLHGFGTCAFLWRNVAPRLANAGYTALALDLLGHGESDWYGDVSYSLAAQAEYVDRALTALRIPRAVLVGQVIGCIVALMLASRRPRQITRLALLSPVDPSDLPPVTVRTIQRGSARAAIRANDLFAAMPLISTLLTNGMANPASMTEPLIARYTAPFIGAYGVSHLLQLGMGMELADEDQIDFAEVSSDTLLVRGEADHWSDEGVVQGLVARLTAAPTRIESLPETGNLIAEDAPDLLVRILLEWLSSPPVRLGDAGTADSQFHMKRP